jgi:hypothetical protein
MWPRARTSIVCMVSTLSPSKVCTGCVMRLAIALSPTPRPAVFAPLFLAVALVAAPAPALAGDAAEQIYAKGIEYRRAGQYEQALQAFKRAHELAPSPKTLGQLGFASSDLHHWVDAERFFTASLQSESYPWVQKYRSYMQETLKVARAHIGELLVRGPAGAHVFVDETLVGTLPLAAPLRLDEGNSTVKVEAPGYKPRLEPLSVHPGSLFVINAVLEPAEGASFAQPPGVTAKPLVLPPPPPAAGGWSGGKIAGVSTIVVGVGAIGGGVLVLRSSNPCSAPAGAMCLRLPPTRAPGWILVGSGFAAVAAGTVITVLNRNVEVAATPSLHAFTLFVRGIL